MDAVSIRDDRSLARAVVGVFVATIIATAMPSAYAQLTDATQTRPGVPGGAIGKSLQQQIGAGRGDEFTPGSSLYLIARDPAYIRRGASCSSASSRSNRARGRAWIRFRTATSWRTPRSAPA